MTTLLEYLPVMLFLLFVLGGTALLAYEMGEQSGFEHGYVRATHLAEQRRVYEGSGIFEFATTTHNEWSNR